MYVKYYKKLKALADEVYEESKKERSKDLFKLFEHIETLAADFSYKHEEKIFNTKGEIKDS